MDPLRIRCFGRVTFLRRGEERRLSSCKHSGLLVYVASRADQSVSRRFLAELFWPDHHRQRGSLSQALYEIRSRLGLPIRTAADVISVPSAEIDYDGDRLAAACSGSSVEDVLELLAGDFAPGLGGCGSRDFERWIDGERLRYHTMSALFLRAFLDDGGPRAEARALVKVLHSLAAHAPHDQFVDIARMQLSVRDRRNQTWRPPSKNLRR